MGVLFLTFQDGKSKIKPQLERAKTVLTVAIREPTLVIFQRSGQLQQMQGSYSNKEMRFQYIPGWVELNFQDISGAVYHTNIDINKLTCTYLILCLI